jgi:hypothetical protein
MLPAHWFGRDKGLPGLLLEPSGGPEEAKAKEKEVNTTWLAVQTVNMGCCSEEHRETWATFWYILHST